MPSTATFLFTDIEGSSAWWERDPAAMRLALERHDGVLRDVVARHGGVVFHTGGDGFGVAFESVAAAVAAALEGQATLDRVSWPNGTVLRVRIGIHTGTVEERDHNYFGTTVNRTARIMDAGHGGQILLSNRAADLVDPGLEKVPLGSFVLRGLREPERIWWLPVPGRKPERFPPLRMAASGQLSRPPVPTRLRFDGDIGFVGRADPVQQLLDAWDASRHGGAPVVIVSGEPGAGKTRLVAEAAHRIHDGGGVVLYGRCDPHGAAAHQPFSEALTTFADAADEPTVQLVLGPSAAGLSLLDSRLAQRLPRVDVARSRDPSLNANHHLVFSAVCDTLAALAGLTAGALLVIDDIQWADASTIALLEHLTLSVAPPSVMTVVICRSTDLERGGGAVDALAALRRRGGAR